ncbi:aminoglycoside 6-adenylyltransferase [Isachenkonia alkalipeptolytica]|nr:aminoglycoside 6-adenylyltransferase [Isachenkonia alkalipeptolytica]
MRAEKMVYEIILSTTIKDPRIRAVYLNGSRANPKAPQDRFQDYDIVFMVEDTKPFIDDKEWLHTFGDLYLLQEPDKLDRGLGYDRDFSKSYAYLMLFSDGVRIDLQLKNIEEGLGHFQSEKLKIKILDKDNILPKSETPTDQDYWVRKPHQGEFESATDNFYWCLQNVAKGILRRELPYAMGMYYDTTLKSLHKMMDWWLGMQHNFQVSAGKYGKYYEHYLSKEYWALYKDCYPAGDYDSIREALLIACHLFKELGEEVATALGYPYPRQHEVRMMKYLRKEKIIR